MVGIARMLYSRGDLRVVVDVDLRDRELAVELGGELLEDRRDRLAGAAPGGPEIDEHGETGVDATADLNVSAVRWVILSDMAVIVEGK